jgi:hypothetical protein
LAALVTLEQESTDAPRVNPAHSTIPLIAERKQLELTITEAHQFTRRLLINRAAANHTHVRTA